MATITENSKYMVVEDNYYYFSLLSCDLKTNYPKAKNSCQIGMTANVWIN